MQLEARQWSLEQKDTLDTIMANLRKEYALDSNETNRYLYINGEPGSGKSEVLIHAAVAAADEGCKVLILCPTGSLVHAYEDKVPEHANITIATIHAGFAIMRDYDKVVNYAPPSSLRNYELIIIDEGARLWTISDQRKGKHIAGEREKRVRERKKR